MFEPIEKEISGKEAELNFYKNLGLKLRQSRMLKGFSQEFMGENLIPQVTFQQVQKFENGINRVSILKLISWGIITNTPLSFFFDQNMEGEILRETDKLSLAMMRDFQKLPLKNRKALHMLVASMSEDKNA